MSLPASPKSKLYDGCKMLSPNGEFMAFCDRKRMNWYLKRNLATVVDSQTFQLTFTPQGVGHLNDLSYYREQKLSICVVCGTTEMLTKHHVVPLAFRKHLPRLYKSANCFDVVPICTKHHIEYELEATKEKQKWFDHFGIIQNEDQFKAPAEITMALGRVSALLHRRNSLPAERLERVKEALLEVLPADCDINDSEALQLFHFNLLEKIRLMKIEYRKRHKQNNSYKKVIEKFLEEGHDYYDFVFAWRQHFVEHAQPKYLHPAWIKEMDIKPERHDETRESNQSNSNICE